MNFETIKTDVSAFFKRVTSTVTGQATLVLLGCLAIQRYPVLTDWLGKDIAKEVQVTVDNLKYWAGGVILLFVKQFNQTGGSKPTSLEAAARLQGLDTSTTLPVALSDELKAHVEKIALDAVENKIFGQAPTTPQTAVIIPTVPPTAS